MSINKQHLAIMKTQIRYFLCMYKRIGLATEDGEINKEKLEGRMRKIIENYDETGKMMGRCLRKNLPNWFPLN